MYIIINDGKYTIRKDGGVLKLLGVLLVILIGQPYEFTVGMKTTDFELLNIERNLFTDDSVMAITIAKGILDAGVRASDEELSEMIKKRMIILQINCLLKVFYGRRQRDKAL